MGCGSSTEAGDASPTGSKNDLDLSRSSIADKNGNADADHGFSADVVTSCEIDGRLRSPASSSSSRKKRRSHSSCSGGSGAISDGKRASMNPLLSPTERKEEQTWPKVAASAANSKKRDDDASSASTPAVDSTAQHSSKLNSPSQVSSCDSVLSFQASRDDFRCAGLTSSNGTSMISSMAGDNSSPTSTSFGQHGLQSSMSPPARVLSPKNANDMTSPQQQHRQKVRFGDVQEIELSLPSLPTVGPHQRRFSGNKIVESVEEGESAEASVFLVKRQNSQGSNDGAEKGDTEPSPDQQSNTTTTTAAPGKRNKQTRFIEGYERSKHTETGDLRPVVGVLRDTARVTDPIPPILETPRRPAALNSISSLHNLMSNSSIGSEVTSPNGAQRGYASTGLFRGHEDLVAATMQGLLAQQQMASASSWGSRGMPNSESERLHGGSTSSSTFGYNRQNSLGLVDTRLMTTQLESNADSTETNSSSNRSTPMQPANTPLTYGSITPLSSRKTSVASTVSSSNHRQFSHDYSVGRSNSFSTVRGNSLPQIFHHQQHHHHHHHGGGETAPSPQLTTLRLAKMSNGLHSSQQQTSSNNTMNMILNAHSPTVYGPLGNASFGSNPSANRSPINYDLMPVNAFSVSESPATATLQAPQSGMDSASRSDSMAFSIDSVAAAAAAAGLTPSQFTAMMSSAQHQSVHSDCSGSCTSGATDFSLSDNHSIVPFKSSVAGTMSSGNNSVHSAAAAASPPSLIDINSGGGDGSNTTADNSTTESSPVATLPSKSSINEEDNCGEASQSAEHPSGSDGTAGS